MAKATAKKKPNNQPLKSLAFKNEGQTAKSMEINSLLVLTAE
jgi:hypothetical protein